MSDWHVEWLDSWLHERRDADSFTSRGRRFGKVIVPGDEPFSTSVTTNGVILARESGEFVHAPIPDTACPPLDVRALELSNRTAIERYRWSVSGDVQMRRGWWIWHHTGQIRLLHTCYDGDFVMEVSSRPIRKGGSYVRSGPARSFNGVCAVIDAWGRLNIAGVGYMEHKEPRTEWQNRFSGMAYLFLVTAHPDPLMLEMVPIPDGQSDIRYRVERMGEQVRFHWLSQSGIFVPTSWVSAGPGRVPLRFEGVQVHAD